MLVLVSDTPFLEHSPPILPIPHFLWENSEPPFGKILKIQTPFIKDQGFQLWK